MAKKYLVADSIPEEVPYLTAGKRYAFFGDYGSLCLIKDDTGIKIDVRPIGCAFLDGAAWRVIEEDD